PLRDAQGRRGHRGAAPIQGPHGDGKALAFLADAVAFGNEAVVEEDLGGVGGAEAQLPLDPPNTHAWRALLHDEGGQAFGPRASGADKGGGPPGVGPGLLDVFPPGGRCPPATRTARAWSPATSDPASGSVRPMAASLSPEASVGR